MSLSSKCAGIQGLCLTGDHFCGIPQKFRLCFLSNLLKGFVLLFLLRQLSRSFFFKLLSLLSNYFIDNHSKYLFSLLSKIPSFHTLLSFHTFSLLFPVSHSKNQIRSSLNRSTRCNQLLYLGFLGS